MNNNPSIATQDTALISSVKGIHEMSKTNDDVIGFRASTKNVQYFPLGLEKHFKNMKLIHLETCPLKQLRQSDLMEYTKLEYLCVFGSDTSIIEAGTFDYNPELQFLNLGNNKLLHIDPNAFKFLNKLVNFFLHSVPCINKYDRGRTGVQVILTELETKCKNPEFLSMHQKFKNLESQTKNDNFKENLEFFEREFKASGFTDIPSFKIRLEVLKSAKIDNSVELISANIDQKQDLCKNCCQNTTNYLKSEKLSEHLGSSKADSSGIGNKLTEIKSLLSDHDSKLANIQTSQETLKSSQMSTASSMDNINSKISDLKALQDDLKSTLIKTEADIKSSFQNDLKASQNNTRLALNDLKTLKSSQDEVISNLDNIKITISDVESSLSKVKSSQTELQSSINKLRLTQNEIGIAVDKVTKNEELEEKLSKIDEKLGNFVDFEVKTNEKFDEIKEDLASNRHKMAINFDEKIKSIEKRLMKKFEDVLEEKLVKILDEKLKNIVEAKFSN